MKNYFITEQLIYVSVEESNLGTISVEYSNGGDCMSFRADVYTNSLNVINSRANCLCNIKIKDNVLVKIPTTTPCITF